MYVLQIVDWYCGLFTPMTVAALECLVIGWIYGRLTTQSNFLFQEKAQSIGKNVPLSVLYLS